MIYILEFIGLFAPFLPAALMFTGNMCRGAGKPEKHEPKRLYMPHWLWVAYCIVIAVCFSPDLLHAAAWLYAAMICTILPTNALMSATHGAFPKRADSKWLQWMQGVAYKLCCGNGYAFGIIYGAVRNYLMLPCVFISPWYALCLLQGLVYFIASRFNKTQPVRIGEGVIGALLGALI